MKLVLIVLLSIMSLTSVNAEDIWGPQGPDDQWGGPSPMGWRSAVSVGNNEFAGIREVELVVPGKRTLGEAPVEINLMAITKDGKEVKLKETASLRKNSKDSFYKVSFILDQDASEIATFLGLSAKTDSGKQIYGRIQVAKKQNGNSLRLIGRLK